MPVELVIAGALILAAVALAAVFIDSHTTDHRLKQLEADVATLFWMDGRVERLERELHEANRPSAVGLVQRVDRSAEVGPADRFPVAAVRIEHVSGHRREVAEGVLAHQLLDALRGAGVAHVHRRAEAGGRRDENADELPFRREEQSAGLSRIDHLTDDVEVDVHRVPRHADEDVVDVDAAGHEHSVSVAGAEVAASVLPAMTVAEFGGTGPFPGAADGAGLPHTPGPTCTYEVAS